MNWQLALVSVIVLGAVLFIARRALGQLRALKNMKSVETTCGSICSGCSPTPLAGDRAVCDEERIAHIQRRESF